MRRIRFAFRALRKTPMLAAVVVLSLGLGIGANTAIFSLLHQVVLRSLPVHNPEELVIVHSPGEFKSGRTSNDTSGGQDSIFSYPVFRALERHAQGVSGLAAFRELEANLAFGSQTVNGSVLVVSGGYFPMLGVAPLIGRTLVPEDDRGAGNPVAVLSYGYWNERLGGRPEVLNQSLRVNGQTFTIVGVAPKGFTSTTFGAQPDAFVPLATKPKLTPGWNGTDRYDDYWLYLLARLKPGVNRLQAAAALNSVYAGLMEEQVKTAPNRDANFIRRFRESRLSLHDGEHGQSYTRESRRTPILILMAATGMVLLIAMANAANLMLARSAERKRELAIRAALGAGRSDTILQLLTEAMILSIAGGVAGILLGSWTLRLLIARFVESDNPVYYLSAHLDWPVLLFALGLSLVTGLLFGVYPAWEASRTSLVNLIKDQSGQASAGRGSAHVRRLLVCAQVMISALLLIPTGLFLKSLVNLLRVDLGLRTENVIGFGVAPELNGYKSEQMRSTFERVERDMAAVPGVRQVTSAQVPLIGNSNWMNTLTVEGFVAGRGADSNSMFNEVGPGFFGSMGIPLIAGREFTLADSVGAPKVAVVNQEFAHHFFQNRNPLGRKFVPGWGKVVPDIEIVGVVKNSHYSGVKQKVPPVYYIPWRQEKGIGALNFYLRTALPPEQVIPQVRKVMAAIDRDLPVVGLRTLDDQVRLNIHSDRLVLQLAAAFALLATLLSMLGLYGVMAYSVTRRTREIGIRMALGAAPYRIRSMVLRELVLILAVGLVAGVPGALALARLTGTQLYGVKTNDLAVVAAAVLALCAAAFGAGYLPARRATRVKPLDALRYE